MSDIPQQAFDEEPLAVSDATGFGDLAGHQGTEDALAPIGGQIHDLGGHSAEATADGRGGHQVADRLHAEEIHRAGDRIHLLGKAIQRAVDDLEHAGGNRRIHLEHIRQIIHG